MFTSFFRHKTRMKAPKYNGFSFSSEFISKFVCVNSVRSVKEESNNICIDI